MLAYWNTIQLITIITLPPYLLVYLIIFRYRATVASVFPGLGRQLLLAKNGSLVLRIMLSHATLNQKDHEKDAEKDTEKDAEKAEGGTRFPLSTRSLR